MTQQKKCRQDHIPLCILLFLCLAICLGVWLPLLKTHPEIFAVEELQKQAYLHFGEVLFFQHVTPPLAFIMNGIIFLLGDPLRLFILFVFVLVSHLSAIAFTFQACRLLKARPSISFLLSLGYFILMLRIEYFRWFANDDPVYLLLPALIWAFLKYLENPKWIYGLLMSFFSGSLVLSSTIPGFVSILLCALILAFTKTSRSRFKDLALLIFPLSIFLILCFKNLENVGQFNICTKGGENGLQFSLYAYGRGDANELYSRLENAPVAQWWRWCYQNSNSPSNVDKLYGLCYGDITGEPRFKPLQDKLTSLGEMSLARMAQQDEEDQVKRPWIFYQGQAPEASRRISAQYFAQAQKIWLWFLLKQPATFVYQAIFTTNRLFIYQGPLFSFEIPEAAFTVSKLFGYFNWAVTMMLAPVLWGGVGLAYLSVLSLIFLGFKKLFKLCRLETKDLLKVNLNPIYFLGIGYFVSNVLFVIATCCELSRMFWLAAPYLVPLAAWGFERLVRFLETKDPLIE